MISIIIATIAAVVSGFIIYKINQDMKKMDKLYKADIERLNTTNREKIQEISIQLEKKERRIEEFENTIAGVKKIIFKN